MPYFNLFQDDERQRAQQPGLSLAFGSPDTSSPAAPAQAPMPESQVPGAGPTPVAGDSGSSFVNFERYVNANKDAATAAAGNVAGNVGKGAEDAATGLHNLLTDFRGQVQSGTGHGVTPGANVVTAMGGTVLTTPGNTRATPAPAAGQMNGSGQNPGAITTGAPTSTRGQNAISEPNAPSQPSPTPAAPKTLTREDLVKGSEQKYTAPASLTDMEGYNAVTGQVTNATGRLNSLQSKEGLSGLLAKEFGSGAVGSGVNELDSLLLGRQGGEKFKELNKAYGDLPGRVDRSVAESRGIADQARKDTEGYAAEYQDLLGKFDGQVASDQKAIEDKAAAAKTREEMEAAWIEYEKPRHETVVRDIGNMFDPTHWAGEIFGFRGLNDRLTDAAEKTGNENFDLNNDSNHVRAHGMPPELKAMWKEVFMDLSPEELHQVEKMTDMQRADFIRSRYAKIQGKGQ